MESDALSVADGWMDLNRSNGAARKSSGSPVGQFASIRHTSARFVPPIKIFQGSFAYATPTLFCVSFSAFLPLYALYETFKP